MDVLTSLLASLFTSDRKRPGIKHPKPCKKPLSPLPSVFGALCAIAMLVMPAIGAQVSRPIEAAPGGSLSMDLADFQVPGSTTEPFWLGPDGPAQALRVGVSPLGAETRAVRITLALNTWVPYSGFENRTATPFALVQQNVTWHTRFSIVPTRRAPFYTDVLPAGLTYNWTDTSVGAFDQATDYGGPSGAHFVGACSIPFEITLRRSEHPVEVARFCVSSPGSPGYVRLDHRCMYTSANWYGDLDGMAPWFERSGPGFGHDWSVAARIITTVAGTVEYLDYEPAGA